MDYSNLTKKEIIKAVNISAYYLKYASSRLQNNKSLLEVLEKVVLLDWYEERMEVLANIREKELLENAITPSIKVKRKHKF